MTIMTDMKWNIRIMDCLERNVEMKKKCHKQNDQALYTDNTLCYLIILIIMIFWCSVHEYPNSHDPSEAYWLWTIVRTLSLWLERNAVAKIILLLRPGRSNPWSVTGLTLKIWAPSAYYKENGIHLSLKCPMQIYVCWACVCFIVFCHCNLILLSCSVLYNYSSV